MGLHIFFATDGSFAARFAQAQILTLPWRPPVHVTGMTVMEVPHPPFTSLIPAARRAYDSALHTLRQDAEAEALGATAWQSTDEPPLSKVTRNLIDEASCSILIVRP